MILSSIDVDDIEYRHMLDERPDPASFHLHTHEDAELYCFLSGRGVYHVEGTAYALSPGDLLLMRPTEGHYIEISPDAPYERVCINFPPDLFRTLDGDSSLGAPFFDRKPGLMNRYPKNLLPPSFPELCFSRIEASHDPLMLKAYLFVLLGEVASAFRSGTVSREASDVSTEYRIIRYINDHLERRITIRSLSERYYLSPSQLDRRFKKATGTTIADYINTKRMLRARKLLMEGRRASDVASLVGFSDYSAFFRAYRKAFGTGPRESVGDRD